MQRVQANERLLMQKFEIGRKREEQQRIEGRISELHRELPTIRLLAKRCERLELEVAGLKAHQEVASGKLDQLTGTPAAAPPQRGTPSPAKRAAPRRVS